VAADFMIIWPIKMNGELQTKMSNGKLATSVFNTSYSHYVRGPQALPAGTFTIPAICN